jgi:hypothetical protein
MSNNNNKRKHDQSDDTKKTKKLTNLGYWTTHICLPSNLFLFSS